MFFLLLTPAFILSCNQNSNQADSKILTDENLIYNNVDQLTQVIIHDVFSPPVSSRIYAYTNLASYEAIRYLRPGYPSLTEKLNGFLPMPKPAKGKVYNYMLASTKAFFTVAKKVTFSKDTIENYEKKVYDEFSSLLSREQFDSSISFGKK